MANPYAGSTQDEVLERRLQILAGQVTTLAARRVIKSQAPAQADSTATAVADLVADFNSLLAKLRNVGLLKP